ncbi:hypothetical protein [Photobacterium kagoshimensis]|uniref:hypothetical protein n=1 Tax=Photobacterium kagoshimensis TaxID=2910242 RepID=UPI003D0D800C
MALSSVIGLVGCNSGEDVAESDSLYVKSDQYKSESFTINADQQVKVKATLLAGDAIEAYVLDESDYRLWLATTQNNAFSNAGLSYIRSITPLESSHETGWFNLTAGNYYILFENTVFGSVKPTLAGGSSSVSYSVLTQSMKKS